MLDFVAAVFNHKSLERSVLKSELTDLICKHMLRTDYKGIFYNFKSVS